MWGALGALGALGVFGAAVGLIALLGLGKWLELRMMERRERFLRVAAFAPGIPTALSRTYPDLAPQLQQTVMDALRDWFIIRQRAGRRRLSMPSQAVDTAWHAFILDTRRYALFCKHAFGRFLHHIPAEAMTAPTLAQEGLRRTWRYACALEGIHPRTPDRLPRLFALDAVLGISGGFHYVLDCSDSRWGSDHYCASHIGASGCGSGDGADAGGDGDGGGCGGD